MGRGAGREVSGGRRIAQLRLFERLAKARRRRRGVKLGRRPRAERIGFVGHDTREHHDKNHPVHVSMRRVPRAPSFRTQRIYGAILGQLARVKAKGVRVIHFSVQHDHLHVIAEGESREDLSNQMRTLFSRIALAVNIVAERKGRLFRDRHHRVELKTPTQVRHALVYVLFNERKHHIQNGGNVSEELLTSLDERSSVAWVIEWNAEERPPPEQLAALRARNRDAETRAEPVTGPETWLARTGWFQRGGGRLRLHELPRF